MLCSTGVAVERKQSVLDAKIAEFGNLTDKTDHDHIAIAHLHTFKAHLNDVSSLLNGTRRRRRSDESKKRILIKN